MTKSKRLKPAEERFCQLYAGRGECFNNATLSYATAYNYDVADKKKLEVAAASSSRLLRNVKILKRCDEVLMKNFVDKEVDKELAWVLYQRGELPVKMRAISEYNKLKGRIEEKIKHSGDGTIRIKHEFIFKNEENKK